MNVQIVLINGFGDTKVVSLKNDLALIILSVFGLGWIKLLIDGRLTPGIINLLLTYIPFAALIHGIYLGVKPEKYMHELLMRGYQPATQEDKEKLERYTLYR